MQNFGSEVSETLSLVRRLKSPYLLKKNHDDHVHQMETFSALLALCAGKSPVTIGFPSQKPVMQSFDVFFDLRLNKQLNKQSKRRWFAMPSLSLYWLYGIKAWNY